MTARSEIAKIGFQFALQLHCISSARTFNKESDVSLVNRREGGTDVEERAETKTKPRIRRLPSITFARKFIWVDVRGEENNKF